MKHLLTIFLVAVLMLSFASCGKGEKEQKISDPAGSITQDKEPKVEENKVAPDTIDNLFIVLETAIKKGDLAKAKELFTPTSIAKINNPDNEAFLGDTLFGQIQFEVKSRFQYKDKPLKATGAGTIRAVVWPSAKKTSVSIQKVGDLYKLDLNKSTGGDSLE